MPTASAKGSDIAPIPAGLHPAVCYGVIDLGTQDSQQFAPSRKVLIMWELPFVKATFTDDSGKPVEKPRVMSAQYTLSLGKKANLRRDLESWRGKPFTTEELNGFEIGKLVGVSCQLNVMHKQSNDGTKTYANVKGIVPLGQGMAKHKPTIPTIVWDIPKSGPFTFPKDMPEWIQNKIKASEEYLVSVDPSRAPKKNQPTEAQMANLTEDPDGEDVPF